jgi:hypothetical protein
MKVFEEAHDRTGDAGKGDLGKAETLKEEVGAG